MSKFVGSDVIETAIGAIFATFVILQLSLISNKYYSGETWNIKIF